MYIYIYVDGMVYALMVIKHGAHCCGSQGKARQQGSWPLDIDCIDEERRREGVVVGVLLFCGCVVFRARWMGRRLLRGAKME